MKRLCWLVTALAITGCYGAQDLTDPFAIVTEEPADLFHGTQPGAQGPRSLIVTLEPGASASLVAGEHGIQPRFVYTHVLNGFAGNVSDAARSGLMRDRRVRRVESDINVTTMEDATIAWGLDRIDQRSDVLDGSYTSDRVGAGVTVYVVDTGIRYSHAEFEGRALFGFDAFEGDGSDCHGHGTHVAGTVGGRNYGVAKGVRLVSVRVLDCAGSGTASTVLAGLDWIAQNGVRPGLINMSLGSGASDAVDSAVRQLIAAGFAVAAAAGNSGDDACGFSPARTPEAMTVGATTPTDVRAYFSNNGPCVDWFAPGVQVLSASRLSDTETASMSGTSMAAPHTAGAAALLLEWNPSLSPAALRDSLWSYTTKNVVGDAFAENAHVLHTGRDHQPDNGDPPPADTIAVPTDFAVRLSTLEPQATISWRSVEPRADWLEIGLRWPGRTTWFIVHRVRPWYGSQVENLAPSTDYEFSVRVAEDLGTIWRYSAWAPSIFARTCATQGGSRKCSSTSTGVSKGKGK